MTTLKDITWKEFQKIIEILEFYRERGTENLESMLEAMRSALRTSHNIEADIRKEDFREMIVCVDAYNVLQTGKFDKSIEKICSKLQRAFFRAYGEKADTEYIFIDKFGKVVSDQRDETSVFMIGRRKYYPNLGPSTPVEKVKKEEYERWKKYVFAESRMMGMVESALRWKLKHIPPKYRINFMDGQMMGITTEGIRYLREDVFSIGAERREE